jgi:hypothetical protein
VITKKGPRSATHRDAGQSRAFSKSSFLPAKLQEDIDVAALRFAQNWDDAARRFLSGMFADPAAGYDAGSEAGLGVEHFPRPELWTIARYLCAAAEIGIQPTIRALLLAAEANDDHIGNGNPADLAWLENLAYGSAAHVGHYAKMLKDYAARRRLADTLRRHYSAALAVGASLDECLNSIDGDLDELRGGAVEIAATPETPPGAVFTRPKRRVTG